MAEASLNPPESLFPMEELPMKVPDEVFKLFHTIDRELYARLVQNLGRDPADSVQLVAFWMWLERLGNGMTLIKRLLSLPPPLLNDLANESALCLNCVRSKVLPVGEKFEIVLLPEILGNPAAGLRFFHENRTGVLEGVNKVVSTVCARAFDDIYQRACLGGAAMPVFFSCEDGGGAGGVGVAASAPLMAHHPYLNVPVVPILGSGLIQMSPRQVLAAHLPLPGEAPGVSLPRKIGSSSSAASTAAELTADDRTIFLTFSKGYPITQDEVREFFTRRFGDFIEDLIMQEVGEDEQVLYARMVTRARSVGVMEEIVGGNKAKYSINGKHVWARKYVRKQHEQGESSNSSH